VASCAAFVQFACASRLIRGSTVAIDGTKLQAVASRKAVIGQRELAAQAQRNAARDRRLSARLLDSPEGSGSEGPGDGSARPRCSRCCGAEALVFSLLFSRAPMKNAPLSRGILI
jgi:hypothetical protein